MSKTLIRSTGTVAGMTMISRLLGFARDVVIASLFGAGMGADAFFIAFKIPNYMRRLFAEGAFSQAFVPMLSEYRQTRSHAQVMRFLGHITGVLLTVLIAVVIIGVVCAPLFITIFAPGFLDEPLRFDLAVRLLRVCFPYILFISITACAGAILNCYETFMVPALTQVWSNIAIIACAIYLSPHLETPIMSLAYGVVLAGIAQMLFQLPFLKAKRLLPTPRPSLQDEGVNKVLKRMVPAIFGVSVAQISLLIDSLFASFLPVGSISWLYYSDRLTQLPLGVFGVAVGTVVLPHLSRKFSDKSADEYSQTLDWALRWLLIIGLPSVLGLLFLAAPVLSTLFQHGRFTGMDVRMASHSLMGFAVGLQFFMFIKVLASGYYARQNIRTPVKIAAYAVLLNIVLNALLIGPLAHAGIALATSIAGIFNALFLGAGLMRAGIWRPGKSWCLFLLRVLFASATLVLWLYFATAATDIWLSAKIMWRASHLCGLIFIGMGIYFGMLLLSGLRLRDLRL